MMKLGMVGEGDGGVCGFRLDCQERPLWGPKG